MPAFAGAAKVNAIKAGNIMRGTCMTGFSGQVSWQSGPQATNKTLTVQLVRFGHVSHAKGGGIFLNFLTWITLNFFPQVTELPELSGTETLVTVLLSLLGLGAMRTAEKFGEKAR